MSAYDVFLKNWSALAELLSKKSYGGIPDKVWEKPSKDLDKLITVLTPYFTEPKVPTSADIKTIKGHGITAQIKAAVSKDRERKAFFSVAYFKEKFASLSDRDLSQALPKGTTKDAYLTAFLIYRYWKASPEPVRGLERAAREIEEEYENSPGVKQAEQARILYRELLKESDFNRVVAVLQTKYPDKAAVGTFAKAVGLKIPAGKKPIRDRLALKILTAGELVRAKF
jgi:hypothetical protein